MLTKRYLFGLFFVALLSVHESRSAKILFYFGSSIYSHKVAVWPLVLKLAEQGHQITFLSPPFPKDHTHTSSSTNVHIFHPKSLAIFWREKESNNETRDVITSRVKGFSDGQGYWDGALQNGLEICRLIFRSLEVQGWVEANTFDLLIIDTPYNECALALAYSMACPHILFGTSSSLYMWHQEMFGLPDETSWLPNYYHHFPSEMSFLQRVRNALAPLQWFYSTNRVSYVVPQLEKLMRKSLNLSYIPSFDELEKGTSLFLLNTHFIQEYPRSLPPFVVPVGGMHLLDHGEKSEEIPEDVAEFLDKYAENGFVYVSFGTTVEFSRAPAMVIEKFVKSFILLEMPILWKWDDVEKAPSGKPKRVYISKWFPQTAILSHPKLKVFITNGGALSHQEALFYGVPLIVFPLTPEDDYNAELIEKSGIGIRMDITYFTLYELTTNIRKLISDVTFKNNVKRLSELFIDRPQSPVDTALWWTEYVLRHKNLTFAKPLAINQPWYQRRLLDVWTFLGFAIFGSLTALVISVNYIFCNNNNNKPPKGPKVSLSSKQQKIKMA